ncbi:hypothetical protein C4B68_14635 [Streptomyces dengpaensis]|uniref:Uncharacterized protein n=1 Tax=Streptomyces dengpaensis TaxID=2049881 RepID=A0ABN5IDU8_9ACTN|nr:hypothetical protein C4B68_14635 [Streptomyces dengpaensis]
MLFGMLVALAPAGAAASAGATCDRDFAARLRCWSDGIDKGTVLVTLDDEVRFDGRAPDRRAIEKTLWDNRKHLVVEVPARRHTGPGGTALLLLANTGWVAPDATIDPLPKGALPELRTAGACQDKNVTDLCTRLTKGPLTGNALTRAAPDLYSPLKAYSVAAPAGPATDSPSAAGTPTAKADDPKTGTSDLDTPTKILAALCVLLFLLLALLLFLIRRSSQAVGTLSRRALAAPGVGTVPASTAHTRTSDETTTRLPDETTTRLRVTPTPRYGRRVGNVPGPARSAVVRTELHPQGYVEIDHVLYRAVWAEPGRPPPAPGHLVDVADARERDSDVLYAFPPATGRHVKGART